jgi:hypothetical protein
MARRTRSWGIGAMLVSACALTGGCSDQPHDPKGDAGADVVVDPQPDGAEGGTPDRLPDTPGPDAPLLDVTTPDRNDGACTADLVWSRDAAKLRLWDGNNGFTGAGPNDCRGATVYEYVPATRSVKQTGCFKMLPVDRAVELSEEENRRLLTQVEALRSTCERPCWADVSTRVLTIENVSACAQSVYSGHEVSGCDGLGLQLPPYIAFEDLARLEGSFGQLVDGICEPDGGNSAAGICLVGDGGSNVCRIGPPPEGGVPRDALEPSDVVADAPPDGSASELTAPILESGPFFTDVDADGSNCAAEPVWNDESVSFTISSSGGFQPPVVDAGCSGHSLVYGFSKEDRTLLRTGCNGGRPVRSEIVLASDQVDQIVVALTALRTTCQKNCGADAPAMSLSTRRCGGQAQGSYQSNFYAGCVGGTLAAPYIDFSHLAALEALLSGIVRASCDDVDAGSAGTCRPHCRQSKR